jgi:K+-transporting ATPase ATPase C chain
MLSQLRISIVVLTILTLLTGIGYPILVTAVAQLVFPSQADGSLIVVNERPIGSELIGQDFRSPAYFWGRPSATAQYACNATASGGSNLGPLNPALREAVQSRLAALRTQSADLTPVPIDLVTASASGLDPHISPAAAEYQIARVARLRGLSEERVREVVQAQTEPRTWGILGEPRVHVLHVNLTLDAMGGADSSDAGAEKE